MPTNQPTSTLTTLHMHILCIYILHVLIYVCITSCIYSVGKNNMKCHFLKFFFLPKHSIVLQVMINDFCKKKVFSPFRATTQLLTPPMLSVLISYMNVTVKRWTPYRSVLKAFYGNYVASDHFQAFFVPFVYLSGQICLRSGGICVRPFVSLCRGMPCSRVNLLEYMNILFC